MSKIAIIEDSVESNEEYKKIVLELWPNCEVHQWYSVTNAINAIKTHEYDIIISDIDLGSGTDSNGALKIVNAINIKITPLLIVSGIAEVEQQRSIYRSLEVWDYLQKPFAAEDLKIQLRRAMITRQYETGELITPNQYESPDPNLEISYQKRAIKWKGKRVHLSQTRFSIIELLLKNNNKHVTYSELMKILPTGKNIESLRVHMAEIKKEFESVDPEFNQIRTKQMVGYGWIMEKL